MDWASAALLALSGATALVYGAGLSGPRDGLRPWLKACPIGALAVCAAAAGGPWLLVAALLLSVLGDVVLALDRGETGFGLGLGAFLLAHIAYAWLFAGQVEGPWLPDDIWRPAALGALIGLGGVLLVRLMPSLGPMRVPVMLYLAVITAMTTLALAADMPGPAVAFGALLFALSDAMLAVERFDRPFPGSTRLIWASYWLAQILIVAGILDAQDYSVAM